MYTWRRGVDGLREAYHTHVRKRSVLPSSRDGDTHAGVQTCLEVQEGGEAVGIVPDRGSADYGKRIRRMSESGALFHRAGTAIHPQGFKLI